MTHFNQSCIITQTMLQDECQMSQAGTLLAGDQKNQMKDNSATSVDGRDLLETPIDNQSNVLFAVQRCLSRHEIDKAKEEIIYDEHLNPKSTYLQQFNENQQQDMPNENENQQEAPFVQSYYQTDI